MQAGSSYNRRLHTVAVRLLALLVALLALSGALAGNVPRARAQAAPQYPIKINFQPPNVPVPAGYLADTGAVYGLRASGLTYGWEKDNSAWGRDRNVSSDQAYDTVQYIGLATPNGSSAKTWELALPNGGYLVRLGTGDAGRFNGSLQLKVEGQTLISATSFTGPVRYEVVRSVNVTDGKLTLTGYDRVLYIHIISPLDATLNLQAQYRTTDPIATDGYMTPQLRLENWGTTFVKLGELKVRYWYTMSLPHNEVFACEYVTLVPCPKITHSFVRLATARPGADSYLELGFTADMATATLGPGQSLELGMRIRRGDGTAFNESDDYSYNQAQLGYGHWPRVTVYRNGALVWGVEP